MGNKTNEALIYVTGQVYEHGRLLTGPIDTTRWTAERRETLRRQLDGGDN